MSASANRTEGKADWARQRAAARRTAWWLALLVTGVFTAFLLTGVLGR